MNRFHQQQDSAGAAEVRVSPEELAAALSRLEARREQEAAQRKSTVPIGETLRELGIDRSPEEVLAEVEALRSAQRTAAKGQSLTVQKRLPFALAAACLFAVSLAVTLVGVRQTRLAPPPAMATPVMATPVMMEPTRVQPTATAGDLNGDGRPDLFVTGPGGTTLLRPRGNGRFEAMPPNPPPTSDRG
jgi:hypothetical protein